MKIKKYNIVCPSCHGTGNIPELPTSRPISTSSSMICPACNGTGVVEVKETDFSEPVYENKNLDKYYDEKMKRFIYYKKRKQEAK